MLSIFFQMDKKNQKLIKKNTYERLGRGNQSQVKKIVNAKG